MPASHLLRVPTNDDTLTHLDRHANAQQRDVESAAGHLLAAAAVSLPSVGRYAVVHGVDLEAIERILGGGSVLNGDDLYTKIQRLAGISFQHVRLEFTPGQLEEVQRRAERQGLTVEQLVARMVPRIHEQFFNLIDTRGV